LCTESGQDECSGYYRDISDLWDNLTISRAGMPAPCEGHLRKY
jgi:hypothetical protein